MGHERDMLLRLPDREVDLSRRCLVMGIVNRTPDSFYEGNRHTEESAALDSAARAVRAGADWVDVGGVPFGPGPAVSAEEETARVLPVVRWLASSSDVLISVDTTTAAVADAALAAGAHIVNDTSGCQDPDMVGVVRDRGAGLVLTHSSAPPRVAVTRPEYDDVVGTVAAFLARRAQELTDAGIRREQLLLDPGHDLNKNTRHSLALTARLDEITALGRPVLVALSRKDFIGEVLGLPAAQRLVGSIAAEVVAVLGGARVLRVHDVAETVQAVEMVGAILGWREPREARHNVVPL